MLCLVASYAAQSEIVRAVPSPLFCIMPFFRCSSLQLLVLAVADLTEVTIPTISLQALLPPEPPSHSLTLSISKPIRNPLHIQLPCLSCPHIPILSSLSPAPSPHPTPIFTSSLHYLTLSYCQLSPTIRRFTAAARPHLSSTTPQPPTVLYYH